MAVINVTTVEQFLRAYTQAVASGDTEDVIEIMADIDFNSQPLTTSYLSGGKKVINGNYHSLSNISTQNVVSQNLFRFSSSNTVTWNKVNFLNLYRNENYNFFAGTSSLNMTFNDCTFQGKGYRLAQYAVFNRCAITFQCTQAISGSFNNTYLNYCWIHVDITRASGNNYEFRELINSYVEGKIEGASGVTDGWHICQALENSVINIDTDLDYSAGLSGAGSISTVTVYSSIRMTGTITAQSNVVPVTDNQMKDAAALAAVGFNIIV